MKLTGQEKAILEMWRELRKGKDFNHKFGKSGCVNPDSTSTSGIQQQIIWLLHDAAVELNMESRVRAEIISPNSWVDDPQNYKSSNLRKED